LCDSWLQDYRQKSSLGGLLLTIGVCWVASIPPAASAETACSPPVSAPPVCLSGTIVSPAVGVALVEQAGHGGIESRRLGDTVRGWQILEIAPKYIRLGQAGNTARVELSGQVSIGDSGPAPPAPAPGPKIHPRVLQARGEREPSQ